VGLKQRLSGAPAPLRKLIVETIRSSGPITFERYMQLCLYHPEFGYYMQERERTGVEGDYFTSPDLHPVFARLVARQAAEMWDRLGRPAPFTWVEMGAGRGYFARDFLNWTTHAFPDFHAALDYVVVEAGPRRRERALARAANARLRPVATLDELAPLAGCFFSNELVDAFPAAVVARLGGKLKEIYVTAEGDALREKPGPISDSNLAAAVARYANKLEEGHRVEISLTAARWIQSVAVKLERGFVMTIDYGDLARRLYTPERPRGTLLAYRRHAVSEDFFGAPGEQDLTAHVNFSALIDAGLDAGLELEGFTTQEKFLMALGEQSQFREIEDPRQSEVERLQARLDLKRLIFPGEPDGPPGMGTIFKVLIQRRGVEPQQLTGLKYESRA
jgi:SAM-dependent MidA family methyltransferase